MPYAIADVVFGIDLSSHDHQYEDTAFEPHEDIIDELRHEGLVKACTDRRSAPWIGQSLGVIVEGRPQVGAVRLVPVADDLTRFEAARDAVLHHLAEEGDADSTRLAGLIRKASPTVFLAWGCL